MAEATRVGQVAKEMKCSVGLSAGDRWGQVERDWISNTAKWRESSLRRR